MPSGVYPHKKEEKSPRWKGDKVSYIGIHAWMRRRFGIPQICENLMCKKKSEKYQWANISGQYKRDRSDWKRLCTKCHANFDNHLYIKGEKQHLAKLNKFQVQRIRLIKEINPKFSDYKIASLFKITASTVGRILSRKTWKHIT